MAKPYTDFTTHLLLSLYQKFMNVADFLKKTIRNRLLKSNLRLLKISPYSILDFESFLYRHLEVHKTLSFIQIGANDGMMNDPIYQFNSRNKNVVSGYVLEPMPDTFSKLVENYKNNPSIIPFNLAIHSTNSEMILYRVNPERANELTAFARGIASFDPEHWRKSGIVPSEDFIEQLKVKCVSFSQFIVLNGITKIDLVILDTEGYDYEILMDLDFKILKPRIIHFEHGLRDEVMSAEKFMKVCQYLNANGYQVIADSYDATAYVLDPNDLIF